MILSYFGLIGIVSFLVMSILIVLDYKGIINVPDWIFTTGLGTFVFCAGGTMTGAATGLCT
jgi:hypothetical protein